jgi:hypothetical protein
MFLHEKKIEYIKKKQTVETLSNGHVSCLSQEHQGQAKSTKEE